MWDLSVQLTALNSKGGSARTPAAEGSHKPLHTFAGHAEEGYANP